MKRAERLHLIETRAAYQPPAQCVRCARPATHGDVCGYHTDKAIERAKKLPGRVTIRWGTDELTARWRTKVVTYKGTDIKYIPCTIITRDEVWTVIEFADGTRRPVESHQVRERKA